MAIQLFWVLKMTPYYVKRAVEIFQEEGPIDLIDAIYTFTKRTRIYVEFFTYSLYGRKYDAPIQPLNLIFVSPKNIRKKRSAKKFKGQTISSVDSGRWDKEAKELAKYDVYSSIFEHFRDDVPWEKTELYNRVKNNVQSDENWSKWGCSSLSDFEKRLEYIDQIYESMSNEGYKKQQEIHNNNNILRPPELHEITVIIGRDGELIFHEGRHRLPMATELEIDEIPVRVLARHKQWQELRDKIHNNGLPEDCDDLHTHPDLQDIVN